jgi:hypothetical protein
MGGLEEVSSVFLKKSAQKTFAIWATGGFTSTVQRNQSFFASFLFTKKKILRLRLIPACPSYCPGATEPNTCAQPRPPPYRR